MRRRAARVALIGVAVLGGAAGVSYATTLATTQSEASVIHACQAKNGLLRVVADAGVCDRKHETPISWAVEGPAGPQHHPGRSFQEHVLQPHQLHDVA